MRRTALESQIPAVGTPVTHPHFAGVLGDSGQRAKLLARTSAAQAPPQRITATPFSSFHRRLGRWTGGLRPTRLLTNASNEVPAQDRPVPPRTHTSTVLTAERPITFNLNLLSGAIAGADTAILPRPGGRPASLSRCQHEPSRRIEALGAVSTRRTRRAGASPRGPLTVPVLRRRPWRSRPGWMSRSRRTYRQMRHS